MSDDLIKKEKAKEAVCKGCLKDWKICHHHWDCPMLTNLEMLPTVDRPQGEWIDAEIPLESGGSMPIQACNLCKTFYPLAYTGGGHRFCPNCGARMKGTDDE